MDARLSNHDVRKRLQVAKAGIDRFFSEGYFQWSQDNFHRLLGPDVSLDDDRILFTLYGWEDAGIVQFVGKDDIYVEVLRGFP